MDNQYDEKIVQINRVSKKTKGGNKMRFSALAVVGDRKGKVGVGLGKSADVSQAIQKAISYAKKHFIDVPIVNDTIPRAIRVKEGAAQIILKPAPQGSGIIAGGAVRSVVEAVNILRALDEFKRPDGSVAYEHESVLYLQDEIVDENDISPAMF